MKPGEHIWELGFEQAFKEMQADAAATNRKNGFNDPDDLICRLAGFIQGTDEMEQFIPLIEYFKQARAGLKLALIMGELGETLEAVRKNLGPDEHIPTFTSEEAEVADAVIRLMNYASNRKLRLAEAIVAKNEFNRDRVDHTTGRAEVHGKKF